MLRDILSVEVRHLESRLLLRDVRIEIKVVEWTDDAIRFRAVVPDRYDGQPRPLEFTVNTPPHESEAELAEHIKIACSAFVAHEIAECILNLQGLRVIDPHGKALR